MLAQCDRRLFILTNKTASNAGYSGVPINVMVGSVNLNESVPRQQTTRDMDVVHRIPIQNNPVSRLKARIRKNSSIPKLIGNSVKLSGRERRPVSQEIKESIGIISP